MDQARGSLEDLNLTKEEVDKFQNAFKDEAFKKMFAEYAAEIADPKNKAESDAYLRQLEMEGKIESVYGKDVQLVMPKAGFVAKTFDEGCADDGPPRLPPTIAVRARRRPTPGRREGSRSSTCATATSARTRRQRSGRAVCNGASRTRSASHTRRRTKLARRAWRTTSASPSTPTSSRSATSA